jgi:hypothetical protein
MTFSILRNIMQRNGWNSIVIVNLHIFERLLPFPTQPSETRALKASFAASTSRSVAHTLAPSFLRISMMMYAKIHPGWRIPDDSRPPRRR